MAPEIPIKSHPRAEALLNPEPEIVPGRRLRGRVVGIYSVPFGDRDSGFVTTAVDALALTFEGIPGDRHSGWTRRAGGREPWYPRGAEMRNERQISLLAPDELFEIAESLGVAEVRPEWIGGNLLIDGVSRFSMLPSGTRLSFEGGAVIVIGAQNHPCRFSGAEIARRYPDRPEIELAFSKVARRLRGLVGWVERPGLITPGAGVAVQIPEQWIYV
jgi:hypothetical protein